MVTNQENVRRELKETVNQLRTLRDEAKLKIHLAGMDARDAWDRLQPKIEEAERAAEHGTVAALESVQQTAKKLRELAGSL